MQDVYLVRKQLADSDRQEINEDLVQALKSSVMESTGTFGATEKKQAVAKSTEYILPNGSLLNHLSQQFLSNPTPENLNNLRKSVNKTHMQQKHQNQPFDTARIVQNIEHQVNGEAKRGSMPPVNPRARQNKNINININII